ncbi:ABC transporter permease [Aerophototrophica crusticola]|uniref:ABC transporter permease n=1 Tax=Aerophototrophica crusticola TaxID=1709002 RepID=A0A858R7K3_9PROT|nr:ABC transporter permease [Rhodospirillaceae bacterium B3]
MALPLSVDIAVTHLMGRRRQTIVSVLGVALGVGFFIAVAALMQGFQTYFRETIIDVSPHVVVEDEFRNPPRQPVQALYAGGAVELRGLKPEEERRGIRNARAMVEALRRMPGVTVAPTLSGQVVLRYGGVDEAASLVGIEPEQEQRVTTLAKDMEAGSLDRLNTTANGIVLGRELAKKLGAKLGDSLLAVTAAGVTRRVTVEGIFHTGIQNLDEGVAYMLLKRAQVLQDRINVVNQVRLRLADPDQAPAVAQRVEARFRYKAESWQETNQNIFQIFTVQNAIMYSIVGAILIVAAFGIFNVISTVIYEKTRDIAILKSMGLTEGDIRRIFLVEGIIAGAIGAVMGWAVGYGLTEVLASIRFDFSDDPSENRFHLSYSLLHYMLGGGFALVAAGLAAYLPARRAARLNPVEIVRGAA